MNGEETTQLDKERPESTFGVPSKIPSWLRKNLKKLGPGLVTGASDDDPSGVATYAQAGAICGFSMLWTSVVAYPLMACIEYTCAKIAMVSGRGLAGVLRCYYHRSFLYAAVILLVVANTINAGTDIGAIASALNLIFPQLPALPLTPIIAVFIIVLQVLGSYRLIANVFKWFTLSLLSYILCAFFVKPDLIEVLKGTFIPHIGLDTPSMMMVVALFGTTISPYCFFWQASQEVEEERNIGRVALEERLGATDEELEEARFDVDFGMLLSVVVMYFIMFTTASTLHVSGFIAIDSAAQAASALRPLCGDAAGILFALGIIGTGFLSVPVLTDSAAYAVAESLGQEPTLDKPPSQEKVFYAVICSSTLVGMLINFIGINPVFALVCTAVINGLLAPPLLIMIMLIANNPKVMGARTNGALANVLGWTCVTVMTVSALLLSFFFLQERFIALR